MKKHWLFEYLPAGEGERDRKFYGTEEEADAYFLEHVVCGMCREETRLGYSLCELEDGSFYKFPTENVWGTGCGCEWELVEDPNPTGL